MSRLDTKIVRGWRGDKLLFSSLMLVAFVLRLALIFYYRTYDEVTSPYFTPVFGPPHDHFMFGFETGAIARSIAEGHGFGSPFGGLTGHTAWIAPVYPYLCALVFKVFGTFSQASAIVILSLNSLFAALTCPLIVRIGERTVGRSTGTAAAWVWAAGVFFMRWPTTWVWDMSLSALLATLALYQALLLADAEGSWPWVKFGLLWGIIALTNPSLLMLLLVSGMWLIAQNWGTDIRFWRRAALSSLVFFAAISPWLVRNRIVMGEWVFVRDNAAYELSLGNYATSNGLGWFGPHPTQNKWEYAKYKQMGELKYIAAKKQVALTQIRSHPWWFVKLSGKRLYDFWYGTFLDYQPANVEVWRSWQYCSMSLLAFLGVWLALRNRITGAILLGAGLVMYPLPYYVTYAQVRYRHAVEPIMLLFGFFLLFWPVRQFQSRKAQEVCLVTEELDPVSVST